MCFVPTVGGLTWQGGVDAQPKFVLLSEERKKHTASTLLISSAAHLLTGNTLAGAASVLLQAAVVALKQSCGCRRVTAAKPHWRAASRGRLLSGSQCLEDDGDDERAVTPVIYGPSPCLVWNERRR